MPVGKSAQVDGVSGCDLFSLRHICLSRTTPHKGKLASPIGRSSQRARRGRDSDKTGL